MLITLKGRRPVFIIGCAGTDEIEQLANSVLTEPAVHVQSLVTQSWNPVLCEMFWWLDGNRSCFSDWGELGTCRLSCCISPLPLPLYLPVLHQKPLLVSVLQIFQVTY